jgi:hypothetical protein
MGYGCFVIWSDVTCIEFVLLPNAMQPFDIDSSPLASAGPAGTWDDSRRRVQVSHKSRHQASGEGLSR